MSAAETIVAAARGRFPDATEQEIVAYGAGFVEALWLFLRRERFARGFAGELLREVGATDAEEQREWTAEFVRVYGALYAEEAARVGVDGGGAAAVDSAPAGAGVAEGGTG